MRQEFSKRTKLVVWNRTGGRCEQCTAALYPGRFEYHHAKEATFDGDGSVANCTLLCRNCHAAITSKRAQVIAKSNRVRLSHIGGRPKKRSFPTNRNGKWRKRMDGTVERRT